MRSLRLIPVLISASLALAACGGSSSPAPSAEASAPASAAPSAQPGGGQTLGVEIKNFTLPNVSAAVGQAVIWTNADSAPHMVTLDDGSVDSGSIGNGGTFSHTFTAAGTFGYHCTIHSSMKGTITIGG